MSIKKSDLTKAYRGVLGNFATGVCLVTVRDEAGNARAMTVNSFTSVSLNPRIILWCVDIHSERYELFVSAEAFSVSILPAHKDESSRHFSREVEASLKGNALTLGETGIPRFSDALAWLDCETSWRQKAGDHVVVFANVTDFGAKETGDALGFFKGHYLDLSVKDGRK